MRLNLAVSLITLIAALAIRSLTLRFAPVGDLLPAILGMISGGVITAFLGASLAGRLSKERLEQVIVFLLVAIGAALIVEGLLPEEAAGFGPEAAAGQAAVAFVFGLGIGLVSSLLGVAGGELIIPTLVFVFGADIKAAGTASALIGLPTVAVGLARYATRGGIAAREDVSATIAPMGIGSVVGAVIGGLLVGVVPPGILKVGLGSILLVSALRMSREIRRHRR